MTDPLPIRPIQLPAQPSPAGGCAPELEYVRLTDLVVEAYQRTTDTDASRAQIARIAAGWNWDKCGALIVRPVRVDGVARLAVIEGQHRAIAALSRGDIEALPAVVVATEHLADAAGAFVSINLDRQNLSACAVFWAEVAAGDPAAVQIETEARRAGVTILRYAKPARLCAPRETAAIGALKATLARRDAVGLRRVLRIAADAALAPISSVSIGALGLALWAPELRGRAKDAQLGLTMRTQWELILDAADLQRLDTDQPLTRCAALELVNRAERGWN